MSKLHSFLDSDFTHIYALAVNAAFRVDYFQMQEVQSVTYFQFQFLLFVCFIAWLTECVTK